MTNRILTKQRLAELHRQAGKGNKNSAARTPSEQEPIHRLQARQIDLERQSAAFHAAQKQIKASLEKYVDLYDLAPVGSITINSAGLIVENNLTFFLNSLTGRNPI